MMLISHLSKSLYFLPILIALSFTLGSQTLGQSSLAVPGTPKGNLPTELLQSRAYCRGIDRQLEALREQFPTLSWEIIAAEASWKSSPFAGGADAIEQDILQKAGEKGRSMLREMDEATWAEAKKHTKIETIIGAREFLTLVYQRSKGEIEVPMVRGNLLWRYKPFQDRPEREVAGGYVQKITHTENIGRGVFFEIPMSWKPELSPKRELMSFRNCYGHGNVWMTVIVSATTDSSGMPISAKQSFEAYSEVSLRAAYKTIGIELTSFLKTKVNGMPALLFTRVQPYEQLGLRATRAAQAIRVFSGDHIISFQINTFGPEGKNTAAERIKMNEPLFKMIGGSLRLIE